MKSVGQVDIPLALIKSVDLSANGENATSGTGTQGGGSGGSIRLECTSLTGTGLIAANGRLYMTTRGGEVVWVGVRGNHEEVPQLRREGEVPVVGE